MFYSTLSMKLRNFLTEFSTVLCVKYSFFKTLCSLAALTYYPLQHDLIIFCLRLVLLIGPLTDFLQHLIKPQYVTCIELHAKILQ